MENNINQINLLVAIRTGELPSERSKEYWSDEEREELRRLFWAGKGISEISLLLQHSENAIIQQLVAMNLLTPPGKHRQRAPKVTKCQCPRCLEEGCIYYREDGSCARAI